LNENKIPYIIVGGQAVLIYGEPGLTRDIDITLGINIDRLNDILSIVKKLNLKILHEDVVNFVKETMISPVLGAKGIRIDYIFSFTEYASIAIKKSKKNKIR